MYNTPIYFDVGANCKSRGLGITGNARNIDAREFDDTGKMMAGNLSRFVKCCAAQNCESRPTDRGLKAGSIIPNLSGAQLSEVFLRIKLNRAFPNAARIKKEMARLGYNWGEADLFGPKIMTGWVVKIGRDVAVEAAQTILSVCLKYTDKISKVIIMYYSEEPQYRRSIFIGSEVSCKLQPISQFELRALLEPKITKTKFHKLAAGFKD